jgi:hypothetical protein
MPSLEMTEYFVSKDMGFCRSCMATHAMTRGIMVLLMGVTRFLKIGFVVRNSHGILDPPWEYDFFLLFLCFKILKFFNIFKIILIYSYQKYLFKNKNILF